MMTMGERMRAMQTSELLVDDVEWLAETGCSWWEIVERLDTLKGTVESALGRVGKQAVAARISAQTPETHRPRERCW